MKIFLSILICLILFPFIAFFLFPDYINSLIPGWKTTLIPGYVKDLIFVFFNIILPIYFYIYFKDRVNKIILLSYIVICILTKIILEYWPKNYVLNGAINYELYTQYFKNIMYLSTAKLILDFLFYNFLLYIEIKSKKSSC